MTAPFDTENRMCEAFQEHLEQLGWDCYPEVQVSSGGMRADLVAWMRPVIWVIEAKLRLNDTVVEQAVRWVGRAHFVSILIPRSRQWRSVATEYCRLKGVGVIVADRHEFRGKVTTEFTNKVENRLCRRTPAALAKHLHPDMKRYAPGSPSGYSSPWKRTMDAAVAFIAANPGAPVKAVVGSITHHYSADKVAMRCLLKWLDHDGRVKRRGQGKGTTWWPAI